MAPSAMKSAPVLIAGGGPVGMTLACELSRHGIGCMLVERNESTTRFPKMDITNARSMELFRRLDLADSLRAVAVSQPQNRSSPRLAQNPRPRTPI
jgi:2-polyprenyl-6-methoxyphenol hydroxylase-like FAD-dependent oxidoreductase